MRIAVAGGTGVVGALLVEQLRTAGHEVVTLARATGVDLTTGTGLDHQLDGVEAVVDVLSIASASARETTEFFTTTTRHLLDAEYAAGVRHHLLLSIVGIDDIPFGYYVGKVAQEHAVEDGKVPFTILRATQFHEFGAQLIDRAPSLGPLLIVPQMRAAPVAAAEVAAELARLASGVPQGRVPDLRGPDEESVPAMTRRVLRKRGSRRPVLAAFLPGKAGKGLRKRGLIPSDGAIVGKQTFDEWLEGQS